MHQVDKLNNGLCLLDKDLLYLHNQQETLKESADVNDKIEVDRTCARTSAQRIIRNTILANRASSTPHQHSSAS